MSYGMKKIYCNADFIPMTAEGDTFEALLVDEQGIIAFAGTLAEARRLGEGADECDMGGKTVTPGFIDPHSHLSGTTQYLTTADLSGCVSFDDIKQVLTNFIAKRGIGESGVAMATGYDQNSLVERRHPDRYVLDEVSSTIPIVVLQASSHMGVANSKALALAGITSETPDPEGGRYGRTEGAVDLDGYCEEPAALAPLYAMVQPRMNMDIPSMLDEMQEVYLKHGITTCQDGATPPDFADIFCAAAREGSFKLDVVAYPMWGNDVDAVFAAHPEFDEGRYLGHFRFGGVKMFLDGSPQGRTAWMTAPYLPQSPEDDPAWCAYGTMTDEEATAFAKKAIDGGHQLLAHCNGDAAADQLLRVYKAARDASENPERAALRPVMIHCQTTRKDQYEQMSSINMIPSIFISHIWYWGDVHLKNFGQPRANRISAARDALEFNTRYTFHTDTPVIRPNMLEAVWCAVNRVSKEGVVLGEEQKISTFQALKGITVNGAYQYGEEDSKGTLEVGKLADLAVLDANPLKVAPEAIRDIKVIETIKEGQTVYAS